MNTPISSGNIAVNKINREFSEQNAQQNAQSWSFPYVDIAQYPVNPDVTELIPEADAIAGQLMAFDKKGQTLKIALTNPKTPETKKSADFLTAQGFTLEFYICSSEGLAEALKIYQSDLVQKKSVQITHKISEEEHSLEKNWPKFEALSQNISTRAVPEILNEIYLLAVVVKASDIHFQPQKNGFTLRLRINGVLQEILQIPLKIAKKMVPQIKYDGGMKSNITQSPQDGRIQFHVNDRVIELRISTLPMNPMESIVMRVLDSQRGIKGFSELGFNQNAESKIIKALNQKNGIILVTGPTGSGKTTTLYSMLKELNNSERKLVTLEDPIEYQLPGVSQSQVNETHDYNFETGFKSLLRHDPDVILVGEIRTIPTAKLAFEAALTGHTVISSLHTNSAIGAISRLRNMGMENYNIAPTINAVFAQKLLRTISPDTKIVTESLTEITKKNPRIFAALERLKTVDKTLKIPIQIAVQLDDGQNFGDQTVICEAFVVTDQIRQMVLNNESEQNIRTHLQAESDFTSLFENGLLKVLAGQTTLNELLRIAEA